MENIDLRGYSPGFDDPSQAEAVSVFQGQTPGNRISPEQFEAAGIPPETQELLKQEIARQLSQAEPIYKLVHSLRVFVTKTYIKGMHDYKPPSIGFTDNASEGVDARELIKRTEQTVKFLNILFEDMRGMASEVTSGIRRVSMGLQTQLAAFVFRFKEYAGDGIVDRSNEADFYQDVAKLQMLLSDQEIALEMTRGKIK